MVKLVQEYGSARIIVNSAADWGQSDPLKVRKTADAFLEAGLGQGVVDTICWKNPIAFFSQSERVHFEALEEVHAIDQTELYEGNSVLRGQAPQVHKP